MLRITSIASTFRQIRNVVFFSDSTSRPFDTTYTEIPPYPVEKPQTLEIRKARLLYQSRKRGMLENDLILSTFAKKYLNNFSEEQTMMYDRLINGPSNDWDIYYWIIEKRPTPKEYDNEIMDMLKKHAKNADKIPLRMPQL